MEINLADSFRNHEKAYRNDIDGLRAIAVLAVVLFHCKVPYFGGGFVGVDVFFVVSGYVISSLIYRQIQKEKFSIASFYERRFNRIIPALTFVQLFVIAVGLFVPNPTETPLLGRTSIAATLSFSNIFFY